MYNRVVCPNFGRPVLTSSSTKYLYIFVGAKNSFATIVNGLSVLKLFKLSNDDLLFSYNNLHPTFYKVCKPGMKKLGQSVRG